MLSIFSFLFVFYKSQKILKCFFDSILNKCFVLIKVRLYFGLQFSEWIFKQSDEPQLIYHLISLISRINVKETVHHFRNYFQIIRTLQKRNKSLHKKIVVVKLFRILSHEVEQTHQLHSDLLVWLLLIQLLDHCELFNHSSLGFEDL